MALKSVLFVSLLALASSHCLYDNKPKLNGCLRSACRASPTAGCVTGCLAGSPNWVRPSCAVCLGNGVVCAYRRCYSQCSSGINGPCTTCISANCGTCGGANKEANNVTELAELKELAELSLGLHPEAHQKPAEKEAKVEQEDNKEVVPAMPKVQGCWEDQASLKFCGSKCFSRPNKQRCATDCLIFERGMSRGCAECFGHKVSCTIGSCLSECMSNSNGPVCKRCVRTKCGRCNFGKSKSEEDEDAFLKAVIVTAIGGEEQPNIYP